MKQVPEGRRKIEGAVVDLFPRLGASMTTRDIARHARVAEGTLYRHFRTKDELLKKLFLEHAGTIVAWLSEAAPGGLPPDERLRRIVRALFACAAARPGEFSFFLWAHEEIRVLPREARLPRDLIRQAVIEGQRGGSFRDLDPDLATAIVAGIALRPISLLLRGALRTGWEQAGAGAAEAAVQALRKESHR